MGGLGSFLRFAQSEPQMTPQSHIRLQSTTAQTPGTPTGVSQGCGETHPSTVAEKTAEERSHDKPPVHRRGKN